MLSLSLTYISHAIPIWRIWKDKLSGSHALEPVKTREEDPGEYRYNSNHYEQLDEGKGPTVFIVENVRF